MEGETKQRNGSCAPAEVTRKISLHSAPKILENGLQGMHSNPKLHYNFVVVKVPKADENSKHPVVPPPQQKTHIFVLNKETESENQEYINTPSQHVESKVFFINYKEGDNPDLPGGIKLQEALSQPEQFVTVIEGGSSANNRQGAGANRGAACNFAPRPMENGFHLTNSQNNRHNYMGNKGNSNNLNSNVNFYNNYSQRKP